MEWNGSGILPQELIGMGGWQIGAGLVVGLFVVYDIIHFDLSQVRFIA